MQGKEPWYSRIYWGNDSPGIPTPLILSRQTHLWAVSWNPTERRKQKHFESGDMESGWTAWEESCIKKVTVVLPSEAPFCCPVWLKAAGSEPQPRDKGLFWLREVIVVRMGQNGREAFDVVRGLTKCHNQCLQDVTEFCKHVLSTFFVPGTRTWWRHNPIP